MMTHLCAVSQIGHIFNMSFLQSKGREKKKKMKFLKKIF